MQARSLTCVLALTLPLAMGVGCSKSSSRGFSSTASPVTSGNPSGTTSGTTGGSTSGSAAVVPAGPLAKKAGAFQTVMEAWHLGKGQVQDIRLDANGNPQRTGGAPSRCLWTGVYAATQAMRYRQTNDPAALQQMENALQTLHDLHEITGKPGVVTRGFDDAAIESRGFPASGRFAGMNYNQGETSRDQYAGWFYGIAEGFDLVQDPQLKADLIADVRAVCDKLMADDLSMKTPWGPNNTPTTFFDLKPDGFYQDQINAQNWAKVDDFPFNLITKAVPYSQPLADAIKSAPVPPIRAGEGLRAVFFFTVAEHVTGDAKYGDYKRQLLDQKGYANVIRDYVTILDDIFYGRNMPVVEKTIKQLFQAIGHIVQAYLVATGQSALVTQLLVPVATAGLSGWIADLLTDALLWIQQPNNSARLQKLVSQARIGVLLLNLVGQQKLATQVDQILTNYGPLLSKQGLIDFARTVRSHLGVNLTLMPLSAMTKLEQDPTYVALYKETFDKFWFYVQDDHNPVVNLMHHGYGNQTGINDVPHAVDQLDRFPVDMSMREVDNSALPGVVMSPFPDRLGKHNKIALQPGYFPIDQKAPDIFPWRGHPRQVKTGSNDPSARVAPLGYLYPYWLARDLGVLGPGD